jgi:hypothetical protein
MNNLRRIHLYLGCLFAPMLVFFAISGTWQTLGAQWKAGQRLFALLSTLHMSRGLKGAPGGGYQNLSSTATKYLVIAMAVSLIITIVLGVVMAFRFGHRLTAMLCLLTGVVLPVVLVLMFMR